MSQKTKETLLDLAILLCVVIFIYLESDPEISPSQMPMIIGIAGVILLLWRLSYINSSGAYTVPVPSSGHIDRQQPLMQQVDTGNDKAVTTTYRRHVESSTGTADYETTQYTDPSGRSLKEQHISGQSTDDQGRVHRTNRQDLTYNPHQNRRSVIYRRPAPKTLYSSSTAGSPETQIRQAPKQIQADLHSMQKASREARAHMIDTQPQSNRQALEHDNQKEIADR